MSVHKTVLLNFAQESFFTQYADTGVFPETPMKVQNSNGENVSLDVATVPALTRRTFMNNPG